MTTKTDWHGWSKQYPLSPGGERAKVALHIGPLPGRKAIALYTEGDTGGDVLAYFRSEQAAQRAMAMLDHIMLGSKLP